MLTYKSLKRSEKRVIEELLQADPGYILDFSNRTIEEYFEDEFGLEFYHEKYSFNGESKAKRLRAILAVEDNHTVLEILRTLWNYRSTLPKMYRCQTPEEEDSQSAYFAVVHKLEGETPTASLDALEKFDSSITLGSLLNSIERDIRADEPASALDRLHTYCQRKFRKLLEGKGVSISESDPLHSRVGKYSKLLEKDGAVSQMTLRIVKNSISIFESFNAVRNDQSLAHDNKLIDLVEARFIFDSVCAVLRFLKSAESDSFGQ